MKYTEHTFSVSSSIIWQNETCCNSTMTESRLPTSLKKTKEGDDPLEDYVTDFYSE